MSTRAERLAALPDYARTPRQGNIPRRHGAYFVRYEDGTLTWCMPEAEARVYARIFRGEVERHPAFPTLRERLEEVIAPVLALVRGLARLRRKGGSR